jgi:Holliday junction resolvase RusA-like endonuclease
MAYPTGKNGRRFKSKRMKEWEMSCPDLFNYPEFKKATVSYLMFFPDDRVRDGQSYQKAPLDYITNQGIFEDDNRRIVKGEQWFDGGIDRENPRIEITIKEYRDNGK